MLQSIVYSRKGCRHVRDWALVLGIEDWACSRLGMLTDNGQTGVITAARIAARLHQPQGCHRRH